MDENSARGELIRCWAVGTYAELYDDSGIPENCGGSGWVDCECGCVDCEAYDNDPELLDLSFLGWNPLDDPPLFFGA